MSARPMIPHPATPDQTPTLGPPVAGLAAYVSRVATAGTPAHEAESGIWTRILAVGRQPPGLFSHPQGTGGIGESVTLTDGTTAQRLPEPATDVPIRVRGFPPDRTVHGTRAGQAVIFVPLDARLHLPAGDYSYLLHKWDKGPEREPKAGGDRGDGVLRRSGHADVVASRSHDPTAAGRGVVGPDLGRQAPCGPARPRNGTGSTWPARTRCSRGWPGSRHVGTPPVNAGRSTSWAAGSRSGRPAGRTFRGRRRSRSRTSCT